MQGSIVGVGLLLRTRSELGEGVAAPVIEGVDKTCVDIREDHKVASVLKDCPYKAAADIAGAKVDGYWSFGAHNCFSLSVA